MSDQLQMATALGRIEGKLDEALKSDRDRITKIEKSLERQWWMTFVITPFLLLGQAIARKLGVQV